MLICVADLSGPGIFLLETDREEDSWGINRKRIGDGRDMRMDRKRMEGEWRTYVLIIANRFSLDLGADGAKALHTTFVARRLASNIAYVCINAGVGAVLHSKTGQQFLAPPSNVIGGIPDWTETV